MTYPKAIVVSAALIAVAIVFAAYQPAQSHSGSSARYLIAPDNLGNGVWAIDTETGAIKVCTSDPVRCALVQKQW